MSKRGADLVARTLAAAGVRRIFALSGNQIMPIFDACLDVDIELIHVRHEAAAVHMADAWGRLTGGPGVALLTAGPGHANALSAMYTALCSESPVIVLSGHAPLAQLGRGAFQEMAQAELAERVAKAAWTAQSAPEVGRDVARALRTAGSGRPGPVHVSLPFDLLNASVDDIAAKVPGAAEFEPQPQQPDKAEVETVAAALSQAVRPLILTGPALMRGDGTRLSNEIRELGLPVVGMESPRGVNDPSLGAFGAVLARADLIVLLGKSLDFTLRFGKAPAMNDSCRFVWIDADTATLERTVRNLGQPDRLLASLHASPLVVMEQLSEALRAGERASREWYDEVQAAIDFRPADWHSLESPPEGPLHPVELCRALQPILDAHPDSVLVSDGGEFGQWAQACLRAPHRLINGPSGAIGGALPMAVAARCVYPSSPILALMGDGTVGFQLAEFDTAVRYRLPFVTVVGNDACWNAEHQIQLRDYGPQRLVGCQLLATRYDEVVVAMGGFGANVTGPSELVPALADASNADLPACVNVAIGRNPAPVIATD